MANSKNNKSNAKQVKEVRNVEEPKYYTAYPSYDEDKKIKGLILPIDGKSYYIDLKEPVITTTTRGGRVLYTKKEFNVVQLAEKPMKLEQDADGKFEAAL